MTSGVDEEQLTYQGTSKRAGADRRGIMSDTCAICEETIEWTLQGWKSAGGLACPTGAFHTDELSACPKCGAALYMAQVYRGKTGYRVESIKGSSVQFRGESLYDEVLEVVSEVLDCEGLACEGPGISMEELEPEWR